jgi:hypothetical protein
VELDSVCVEEELVVVESTEAVVESIELVKLESVVEKLVLDDSIGFVEEVVEASLAVDDELEVMAKGPEKVVDESAEEVEDVKVSEDVMKVSRDVVATSEDVVADSKVVVDESVEVVE